VAGAEDVDLVAEREVVGRVGAVGESEGAHYVYKYHRPPERKIAESFCYTSSMSPGFQVLSKNGSSGP
jgi:hypothetical protein